MFLIRPEKDLCYASGIPVLISAHQSRFCTPNSLLAQEVQNQDEQPNQTPPPQQQNVSQLKPVVVTATRMETPLQETAASVTVVGEEEIRQQQATTIAEALRNVPGLEIAQNGS